MPSPVEPQNSTVTKKELTCTLSVSCETILNNMDKLDKNKVGIIPENGVILAEKTAVFYEGENVFNLLSREMKKNKIHLEFVNTPIYNSAYIEGIANIYEFDCGNLSGWMYKVNGKFRITAVRATCFRTATSWNGFTPATLGAMLGITATAEGKKNDGI